MLPHSSRGVISLRFDQMQDRDDVREGDRRVFWGGLFKMELWLPLVDFLSRSALSQHSQSCRFAAFLPQFEQFRDAIQKFCQKDRWYHDHQGNTTFIPGLDALPYNIFGWINDSIDRVQVPYSGPDGDYEGAPRQAQYIDAQESVYSGWKKLHGIKVETVFLPNGISTLFGPVTARQNDRGTLNLSGLDRFLTLIQAALPEHRKCMLFGDSIFHGVLQNITTYYRAIPPGILTPAELKINGCF